MKDEPQNVLAIFSHADDELSCAGTLANHAEVGDHVTLVFLTKGENSTSVDGDRKEVAQKRQKHTNQISELLGVKIRYLDFTDSQIEYNVENGYKIAELIKEIKPDIIISWNVFERVGAGHPDHRNTAKLVYDAINYARYQNNNSEYEPHREPVNFYRYYNPDTSNNVKLQYIDVTNKLNLIKEFIDIYKEAYGDWPVEEFKLNALKRNGREANVEYAEVFEVVMDNSSSPKLLP